MKTLFTLLLTVILTAGCMHSPAQQDSIRGFVYDMEQVFTNDQKKELNALLGAHEKLTSNEIALVTTPDWGDFDSAFDFGIEFGNAYGVGKKATDNGVIIVFSKHMRGTAIATGYGTEKVLTDAYAQHIIDSLMIPQFKENRYYEGIYVGVSAIVKLLELPENEIK